MGSSESGICCCGGDERTIVVTEIKNQDWARAVTDLNLVGVQFLHHSDPDLVNLPVDLSNGMAIHYAVNGCIKMRPPSANMLEYLLENGAEINAQGGEGFNSALHYAMLKIVELDSGESKVSKEKKEPLWECVRLLFAFGIDPELKNNDKLTAEEIILGNRDGMKEFKRRRKMGENVFKQRGGAGKSLRGRSLHNKQASGLLIAGMDLNKTHETTIRRYVKETDDATKTMKEKSNAISNREDPETRFGEQCGIDP